MLMRKLGRMSLVVAVGLGVVAMAGDGGKGGGGGGGGGGAAAAADAAAAAALEDDDRVRGNTERGTVLTRAIDAQMELEMANDGDA